MNKWIKRMVTSLLVTAQFVIIPTVSAQSLEEIRNQQDTVEAELGQVQKNMNQRLSEVSEITISLNKLAQEIEEQELSIEETKTEIEEQEAIVEKRYNYIADQLKVMQKSEVNHNIILGLFEAKSFSDLINRLYTARVLTNANEEQLAEANSEFEKLHDMEAEFLVYKEELNNKKEETDQQKEALDEKLADLNKTLTENEKKLAQLDAEEAKILAEEKAKEKAKEETKKVKEIERKKSVKTASSNQSKNNDKASDSSVSDSSRPEPKPSSTASSTSSSNAGEWMTFESTAYSYQEPGLSTKTASGVNLLENPRVVAVDPNHIPLGSLVEVEGMGVYLAADTGGAINGKIIDVHFSDLGQVRKWGRRNVRIRVLD